MSSPVHTYGPTCLLAEDDPDLAALQSSPSPPTIKAQFFYISSLQIDDPLSPLPSLWSGPSSGYEQQVPPQPFSYKDNARLENAWESMRRAREVQPARRTGARESILKRSPRIPASEYEPAIDVKQKKAATVEDISSIESQGSPPSSPASTLEEKPSQSFRVRLDNKTGIAPSETGDTGERKRNCSAPDSDLKDGNPISASSYQKSEGEDHNAQLVIPVGVSKLHLVELPNLKMKPMYWSPLHDISSVLRATWFYKDSMLPVETELANRLEGGYMYMKPWTEAWQAQLNKLMENGVDEMKLVHKLWPKDDSKSVRGSTASFGEPDSSGVGQRQDTVDAAPHSLTFDENQAAGGTAARSAAVKPFLDSSVIYVDLRNAQILRSSLLPLALIGRLPVSAIHWARQIGIPVVRGFNWRDWDRLHPSKPNPIDLRHYLRRTQSQNIPPNHEGQSCYGCSVEESRPSPTDLVLVIHGIGQKLSERVESFNFTLAINALRRFINAELNNDPVWQHVRPDHGGIMVLPVNWRSALSLADASLEASGTANPTANHFSLNDIALESIPTIRSLINDVLLDIPYYLSHHHRPEMIQAVVKEANRIYRLWCANNPGFRDRGKVHLIAHSLGSVMALDVLSHQPTRVPDIDFSKMDIHNDIFEFDTSNLFFCGSPAGFFLLLNKASLLPRRGRKKSGREGEDEQNGIAGDADTYGCMAVDNFYNIMHVTDPIACRINAAVNRELADSLEIGSIPASSASLLQSLSDVFGWGSSNASIPSTVSAPTRPTSTSTDPSNVELGMHDLTREEIAERRMLLLNDNGQIDYLLPCGSGPLNIQYLDMLSAHSCYWTLADFVRFCVLEIARTQGRDATLPVFRAKKKTVSTPMATVD